MKETKLNKERKLLIEFTERERMHYFSLAEFFAKKFNEYMSKNTFDIEEER